MACPILVYMEVPPPPPPPPRCCFYLFSEHGFLLSGSFPLQNKHGKSADFHVNFAENLPRFSWVSADLKSVENDQSSAESMEIMIRLNVGYKSVENAERVAHSYCDYGKRGKSGKCGTQFVEISRIPRKTWQIIPRDFLRMWKAWEMKICFRIQLHPTTYFSQYV